MFESFSFRRSPTMYRKSWPMPGNGRSRTSFSKDLKIGVLCRDVLDGANYVGYER